MRMTTGIYEKIDEQKRRMMGSKEDDLYYTAYLFGEDKIYSFFRYSRGYYKFHCKNFFSRKRKRVVGTKKR